MGFLMGAYGKLMAGKLYRNLQYQLTSVQSRLNRVTKQVGDMEKMLTTQQKNMKAQMQSQYSKAIMGAQAQAGMVGVGNFANWNSYGNSNMLSNAAQDSYLGYQGYTMTSQYIQQQYAQATAMFDEAFELNKESQLQSLKDLEDSLQTEKDNLDSRLQIAKADYDSYKEMEKEGAKEMVPNYTGQG